MNNKHFVLISIGFASGLLSGIFGLGGGIVVVPALVYFLHASQHTAQGTSLALLLPPISLLGALEYYQKGAVNVEYTLYLAVLFSVGAYLGAHISLKTKPKILQYLFVLYLTASAFKMLLN